VTLAFEKLCGPGKPLRQEPPDAQEIAGLIGAAYRRLKDAEVPSLSIESRFDLAYNASHALCLAALRHHGYRSANRYVVFQLLPHTLGLGPEVWRVLAKAHEIRNLAEYEGDMEIDERITTDLIQAAIVVAEALSKKLE
jgi:hypothetical protein